MEAAATAAGSEQKAWRRRWQGITVSCSTGMPTNNERFSVPMTERDELIRYAYSLLQKKAVNLCAYYRRLTVACDSLSHDEHGRRLVRNAAIVAESTLQAFFVLCCWLQHRKRPRPKRAVAGRNVSSL